jgi:hypothetical protein
VRALRRQRTPPQARLRSKSVQIAIVLDVSRLILPKLRSPDLETLFNTPQPFTEPDSKNAQNENAQHQSTGV